MVLVQATSSVGSLPLQRPSTLFTAVDLQIQSTLVVSFNRSSVTLNRYTMTNYFTSHRDF